jgi:hypothetical protein
MVLNLILVFISLSASALTNSLPYLKSPDLVRIEINQRESVCSGFYVNRTSIITAGHCIRGQDAKQITLFTATGQIKIYVDKVIPHPDLDIGIIKTSDYIHFVGKYPVSYEHIPRSGSLLLLGAGKIDVVKKIDGFSNGTNSYFRFANKLYIMGASKTQDLVGVNVSISPNDSGSPMLINSKVVAIATQSSVVWTHNTFLPALSIGVGLQNEEVAEFLKANL